MKKSRRLISILAGAAMTAAMMSVMTGGAAAEGAALDSNWQYKTMVDFEELADGFEFGSKDDSGYTQYLGSAGNSGYGAKVTEGGYKGSNQFTMYSKGTKSVYAQPLISIPGFQDVNTEFVGAAEFWMWIDISNITLDEVGVQLRLIEGDYNEDGTPAADQLSQYAPEAGKPVYIQDGDSWKEITIAGTGDKKLPLEQMKGYKGFIRIPISSFYNTGDGTDIDGKFNLENVFQIWFIYNFPNNNSEETFSVDQLMFVGPSLNEGKSITKLEGIGLGGGSDTPTTTAPTESQATAATTSTSAASQTTTTAATTRTAATTSPADKDGGSGAMPWIIAAVCVVVAGAGAAVYFLVIRKKKDGPDNTDGPAEGDSSDMDGKAE